MQIKRKKRACRSNIEEETADKRDFVDRDFDNIIQRMYFNESKICFDSFKAGYFIKALYLFPISFFKFQLPFKLDDQVPVFLVQCFW